MLSDLIGLDREVGGPGGGGGGEEEGHMELSKDSDLSSQDPGMG